MGVARTVPPGASPDGHKTPAIRGGNQSHCRCLYYPSSASLAVAVTAFGNKHGQGASVAANAAYHVWDRHDSEGCLGAAACIVIPWFADRYEQGADWRELAWWIHDQLPYAHLQFFPKLCAFNIQWHERPARRIDSFIAPKGCLTKPGMRNHQGSHSKWYRDFPTFSGTLSSPA